MKKGAQKSLIEKWTHFYSSPSLSLTHSIYKYIYICEQYDNDKVGNMGDGGKGRQKMRENVIKVEA